MNNNLSLLTLASLILIALFSVSVSALSYRSSYSYNMEIPNHYQGYAHPQFPVASGNKYYYNAQYQYEYNRYKEGYYRTFEYPSQMLSRSKTTYSRGPGKEIFVKMPSLDSYDLKNPYHKRLYGNQYGLYHNNYYGSYPQRSYNQVRLTGYGPRTNIENGRFVTWSGRLRLGGNPETNYASFGVVFR